MDRRRRTGSSRNSPSPTEAHQEWRGRSEVHRGPPEEGRRREESRGSGNLRQPGGASGTRGSDLGRHQDRPSSSQHQHLFLHNLEKQ